MLNLRVPLASACLAIALTGCLLAQDEAPAEAPDTNVDVLVLDHDYAAGAREFARVFLERGQVYRAELSTPDVTLEIHAVGDRIRAPRVYPILGRESSSGASVVELYPDADALYEIRTVATGGEGVATHLRLYRDIRESHRRAALTERPRWELGLELAGGWHSGFVQSSGAPIGADPHSGTDIEACFTARRQFGRGGICAFGIGYQSQTGASSILWFYTETRLGLLGHAAGGRSTWEFGALFRLGVGSIERERTTPWILAPGVYLARQLRSVGRASSWSIQGSYSHAWYAGFPSLGDGGAPHSDHVTLGLGWYR